MINKDFSIILISLFLFCHLTSAEAELSKEQTYSLFDQANQFFRQANSITSDSEQARRLYEKAILNYEKMLNEGQIENGKLYYNLGNFYFLKGDLGKAILNYRRAERLDKVDTNIQKNLAFARGRRVDKVEVKTKERVLQTVFFWHYDLSLKTKFLITCICFAILFVSLSVMVWFGRTAPVTVVVVICGILIVCFFASVVIETKDQASRACGVITAQEVVAHQADWQSSPPSFKEPLHAGTEFGLIEHRPGWLHIRLSDGSEGWIPETAADII